MHKYTDWFIFAEPDQEVMSKAARTKQYIIEKAAPVFNKQGYAGTSMSDLVKITGLTKGAIYGNFLNKDELAVSVFSYHFRKISTNLGRATRAQQKAVDKLLAIVDYYRRDYLSESFEGGCPVLNTSVEADDNHPELRKQVKMVVHYWKRSLEAIIRTGQEQQEINPGADASRYATLIIALIEGGIMMSRIGDEGTLFHTALDHIEWLVRNELKL